MTSQNSKLLPNKFYWAVFIFLAGLAIISTVLFNYGWTLIPFALLAFAFGRGKQEKESGLKKH